MVRPKKRDASSGRNSRSGKGERAGPPGIEPWAHWRQRLELSVGTSDERAVTQVKRVGQGAAIHIDGIRDPRRDRAASGTCI
jgi:hypothetical protein